MLVLGHLVEPKEIAAVLAETPSVTHCLREALWIREVHYALDSYRACFPDTLSPGDGTHDDIPF